MLEQPAFGNRLRALRLERGLSQAALAEGGLSTGYLSRLESGMRSPTPRVVDHVARRLDVPTSAFDIAQMLPSLSEALANAASAEDSDDLIESLTQVLQTDDGRNPILRWQALWQLSRMLGASGRHGEEHALLVEMDGLSAKIGSAEFSTRTQVRLSRAAYARGENAGAYAYAVEAHRLSTGTATPDRSEALQALIVAEAETGRLTEARMHARELCELTEPTGGILFIRALWATATVSIRQADYSAAKDVLEQALRALDSHVDLILWIRLRLAAASLYLQISPPLTGPAGILLTEVAPVVGLVGADVQRQQTETLQAHLAFEEGRIDDAREMSARLAATTLRLSFRDSIRFRVLQSKLLILDGRVEEGTTALRRLAEEAQAAPNVELAAEIWRDLAGTLADTYGKGVPV